MAVLRVLLPLSLLAVQALCSCSIRRPLCSEIPPMNNFDRDRYMWNWYRHSTWESDSWKRLSCPRSYYSPDGDVNFKYRDWEKGTSQAATRGIRSAWIRKGQPINPLFISHRRNTQPPKHVTPDHIIVDTDYSRYSVAVTCNGPKVVKVEVLTRRKVLQHKDRVKIGQVLSKVNLRCFSPRDHDLSKC